MEERIQIRDLDVYAVSDKGDEELKRGSTELSKAALELLVLLDGKTSIAELAARTSVLSPEEIRQTAARTGKTLALSLPYSFLQSPVSW